MTEKPAHWQKLERIFRVSLEVSNVKDIDVLMERILKEARGLVNADAGSIYIKEDESLRFNYTQNETLRARLGPNRKLPFDTFRVPINNASMAGYAANTGRILNIPDVYSLPDGLPFAFDPRFDETTRYRTQSVLTIPLKDNRDAVVGVLQIINPRDSRGTVLPFAEDDIPLFQHFANNAAVAIERAQMTRTIMMRMIKMAEMRDPYETGPHANRVASYALEIFETWSSRQGMPEEEINQLKDILKVAAILHDVGKIAISDTILKKPGKLNDDEFDTMKSHTFVGARLFADSPAELDRAAASVALNHHERWDGKGYPGHVDAKTGEPLPGFNTESGRARGKKGPEIPVFGRVVAIADVFDALSSRRVYKPAWSEEEVVAEIVKGAGCQFDPDMVQAFTDSMDAIREVAKRYPY